MEELLILLPVGLGDALMINGLVRHFSESYNITLGVSHLKAKNVQYFFRDMTNLKFLSTNSDDSRSAREQLFEQSKKLNCKKMLLGYYKQIGTRHIDDVGYEMSDPYNWVSSIYENDANISKNIMYTKFFVQRDRDREEEFYEKVVKYLGTDKYIVVSENHGKLDISKDLKIFYLDKGKSEIESDIVMDYCTVIERAQEFHGPDCGWVWLVEMINLNVPKRFIHQYSSSERFDSKNFPENYFNSQKWISLKSNIKIPVNKGELLDRISILEIKLNKITCPLKYNHVKNELNYLEHLTTEKSIDLENINTILWNVEDELRIKEKEMKFDSEFIRLSRLVYTWNDKRYEIKNKIDSNEQKQYTNYNKNKPDMLILFPLGFGDGLVVNGLIREFAERYNIIIGVENYLKRNITYMFRDLTNIRYIITSDDDKRDSQIQVAEKGLKMKCEKLYLGYMKKLRHRLIPQDLLGYANREQIDWARNLYRDANLNPRLMHDNFFVLRDRSREENFYRRVIEYLGTTEYITISDCPQRGSIDRKKIPENMVKTFTLGKGTSPVESDCIFDYRLVIEKAQAYHGPDGGFSWLVEMCKINVPKKYLHMYDPLGRSDPENFPKGYYRTDWIVFR